jgi:hypothetical protein
MYSVCLAIFLLIIITIMDENIIIIENARAYIEDIDKRLKEMESWGTSWKNSTFYNDLLSKRRNWIRRKNEALKAIQKHSI